jgi:hypothetical protein
MSAEDKEAHKLNRQIDDAARKDAQADSEKVKLLLLGAGESGKSTVFKQMRVLYGQKETPAERMAYTPVIHNNVMTAMKMLLEQSQEFGYNVACADSFRVVEEAELDDTIDAEMGKHVKQFWKDPGIQVRCIGHVWCLSDRVLEYARIPGLGEQNTRLWSQHGRILTKSIGYRQEIIVPRSKIFFFAELGPLELWKSSTS